MLISVFVSLKWDRCCLCGRSYRVLVLYVTQTCSLFHEETENKRQKSTSLQQIIVLPVVEGSSSQDDGVVVGPFRGVAPGVLQGIPEVAPRRVSHDPLGEAPPHQEGKVHLRVQHETWRDCDDPFWEYRFLNAGNSACTQTSLVSRTVSSSRLSTASVSMATWGRNRLVVCKQQKQNSPNYDRLHAVWPVLREWVRDDRVTGKSCWVTEMTESL